MKRLICFSLGVILASQCGVLFAQEEEAKPNPVPVETVDGKSVVKLEPANTKIEFVGTHVGDDPKPRLGGFGDFSGQIHIADNKPTAIAVDMKITSIWTEFDNLTKHLMNEDFFEADKFPSSRFESTSINVLGDGNCIVSGKLTLHGKTSEIEFPAKFRMEEKGLVLMSEFTIDRTDFGMDKMTDGVEKVVSLNVVVGMATRGAESKPGNGSDSSETAGHNGNDPAKMDGITVKISLPNMT